MEFNKKEKDELEIIKKYHKRMFLLGIIVTLCAITLMFFMINYLQSLTSKECNCDPKFYDYIIDLKKDQINVYTDDGREYIVEPDSLDEFIIKDNL